MTTFNFDLNNRPNKNGIYNIQIRITQNKIHKRIKTPIYVKSPNDFNAIAKHENWVRKAEPLQARYNATLKDELEKVKEAYQELRGQNQASLENIKNKVVSDEVSSSFLEFAKERTTQIFNEGAYRNYKKYNGFCNKLETYLKSINKTDLLFSELTTGFVIKFENYLRTLNNTKKKDTARLHQNYIAKLFDIFKALVNKNMIINHINPNSSPFIGFTGGKTIATQKPKLSCDEVQKIEELDLPVDSLIWHSRNVFLFSFYFAGIRAGDVLQLRWKNIKSDGRLEYTMDKNNKVRDFRIHDKALQMLKLYYNVDSKPNDYIFPFLDSKADYAKANTPELISTLPPEMIVKLLDSVNRKNSLINKELGLISNMIGVEQKITLHIARHTFAKRAADVKTDNNITKLMLAHSNLKETEIYMGNFNTKEVDDAMDIIFNYGDDPKAQIANMVKEMDTEQAKLLLEELKLRKAG
jgi:integrase